MIVHPLVLLSVVDHYNRVLGRNKNRRVVGVLLGRYKFLLSNKYLNKKIKNNNFNDKILKQQ